MITEVSSACVRGPAGSGKSTLLAVLATIKDIILSFTNKAVVEIYKKCLDIEKNIQCKTLSKALDNEFNQNESLKEKIRKLNSRKTLYDDEFSMIPYNLIKRLYQMKFEYGKNLKLFGDPNQLLAVETYAYDYSEMRLFKQLADYKLFECS